VNPLGLYNQSVHAGKNTGLAGDPQRQANSIAAGL
jgi:hypothetical protein